MRKLPTGFELIFFQGLIILDLRFAIYELQGSMRVNRKSHIVNSKSFPRGRPALFHQREQVPQRLLIITTFRGGQLAGAFVQLRGHLRGFFRRTAEGDQSLGELGNFHGANVTMEGRRCTQIKVERRGNASAP